jgi:hypothetical protein
LRIGIEGSREGTAGLALGEVHYSEPADAQRTAAFRFDGGLKGWGLQGTAAAKPQQAAGSSKQVLDVSAVPGQTLMLNSRLIPVTPGQRFVIQFNVHVRRGTETGYLVVFFSDESHRVLLRLTEPLLPERERLVKELITDANGRWEQANDMPILSEAREIRLSYGGDQRRRPAIARLP